MVEARTCDSTDVRLHVGFGVKEDSWSRTTADNDMVSGPILINFLTEECSLRFVAVVLFVFS